MAADFAVLENFLRPFSAGGQSQEQVGGTGTQLNHGYANGGQRGRGQRGGGDIIDTDDAQVLRNAQASDAGGLVDADGEMVASAEHGGWAFGGVENGLKSVRDVADMPRPAVMPFQSGR